VIEALLSQFLESKLGSKGLRTLPSSPKKVGDISKAVLMTFDEKTHQLTAYFCSISCVVGDGLVRMIIIVGLERKGRSNKCWSERVQLASVDTSGQVHALIWVECQPAAAI
jgi:hypothetical protein